MINPDIISTRLIDRLVMSHDASLYRLVPTSVVRPRNIDDIRALFEHCTANNEYLTFRTGGTSLSGQAVTDGILVDLSRNWDQFDISSDGATVTVAPGITGGRVNGLLRRHGRKLGPDPASMSAAMIGGIVANNASGMCCGTELNTYHTMQSIRYMLANGVMINTSERDADATLRDVAPNIHAGIAQLRNEITSNNELVDRIRRKYRIKNTVGYSLNAFLDETEPARIIGRLMVGSEGTLGFIASVTYNTVPDARKKWTQIFVYESIEAACESVPMWTSQGAAAVELMDDASLHSFAHLQTTPEHLRITANGVAALLVEFHDVEPQERNREIEKQRNRELAEWVTDSKLQAQLWHLRKGLMPTIGAMRPAGSTMINEDVAVSPEKLASLVRDVKGAFTTHGYHDAIIFGHAKDGNIHFIVNQDFSHDGELERYARFMEEIASIVADKHQGSLKAEHGTGRNMAPFVEREWGTEAYAFMRRLKTILDPHGILNPDVLLNNDPQAHLKNIKPVPTVDPEVNACIECGFCEHVCPTRSTTLTPRQRIILRRELSITNNPSLAKSIRKAEQIESIDSCAVDSMCSVACPVGIDTGAFVKRVRSQQVGGLKRIGGELVQRTYGMSSRLLGASMRMMTGAKQRSSGKATASSLTNPRSHVLYFPGCPSRWLSDDAQHIATLAQRAGIELKRLPHAESHCCGQAFESQGLHYAAERSRSELLQAIKDQLSATDGVVITDVSTCAASLSNAFNAAGINPGSVHYKSPIQWLANDVLPHLEITNRFERLAVHPGCGVMKSAETDALMSICSAIAHEVVLPPSAFCCGMAGAHGIQHSNIPPSVLAQEKADIDSFGQIDCFVSLNPICESALTKHIGIECKSLFSAIIDVTLKV